MKQQLPSKYQYVCDNCGLGIPDSNVYPDSFVSTYIINTKWLPQSEGDAYSKIMHFGHTYLHVDLCSSCATKINHYAWDEIKVMGLHNGPNVLYSCSESEYVQGACQGSTTSEGEKGA